VKQLGIRRAQARPHHAAVDLIVGRRRTRWASALILFPAAFTTLRHNRSTNPLRLERPQGRRQRPIGDRFDRTAALVRTSRVA